MYCFLIVLCMISQLQGRSRVSGSGTQSRLSSEAPLPQFTSFFFSTGDYIHCAQVVAHEVSQCCCNLERGALCLMVIVGARMVVWWTGTGSRLCPGLLAGFPSRPLMEALDARLKIVLTCTSCCLDINALICFSLLFSIRTIMLNLLLFMIISGLRKSSLNNQGFLKKKSPKYSVLCSQALKPWECVCVCACVWFTPGDRKSVV